MIIHWIFRLYIKEKGQYFKKKDPIIIENMMIFLIPLNMRWISKCQINKKQKKQLRFYLTSIPKNMVKMMPLLTTSLHKLIKLLKVYGIKLLTCHNGNSLYRYSLTILNIIGFIFCSYRWSRKTSSLSRILGSNCWCYHWSRGG